MYLYKLEIVWFQWKLPLKYYFGVWAFIIMKFSKIYVLKDDSVNNYELLHILCYE